METRIRPAEPDDGKWILSRVLKARLNPSRLDLERFVVADLHGQLIGMAHIRVFSDGTRELSTLYVEPEYRHKGICMRMVRRILEKETEPVYTVIDRKAAAHYLQAGFEHMDPADLPGDLGREFRLLSFVGDVSRWLRLQDLKVIPLMRATEAPIEPDGHPSGAAKGGQ